MTNYGERAEAGGPQTAAITNDDAELLDIPEEVKPEDYSYAKVKDERSF